MAFSNFGALLRLKTLDVYFLVDTFVLCVTTILLHWRLTPFEPSSQAVFPCLSTTAHLLVLKYLLFLFLSAWRFVYSIIYIFQPRSWNDWLCFWFLDWLFATWTGHQSALFRTSTRNSQDPFFRFFLVGRYCDGDYKSFDSIGISLVRIRHRRTERNPILYELIQNFGVCQNCAYALQP